MALISMTAMLERARTEGYGVGYFEAWDVYSMEAVLEAAEEERSPVILGFGGMMVDHGWLDAGGLEALAGIGNAIVARAKVPVSLLLNEAKTFAQMERAIDLGFNAVMLDTSDWSYEEGRDTVARLVQRAHARGVAVEAELGHLPDATDGGLTAGEMTDPDEAADFVARTGVDCLAVSFGNVHLLTDGPAPIDMAHLETVRRRVSVPFVVHGGTSFPPDLVPAAVALGAVKFNVGTVLKTDFLNAVRRTMAEWPTRVNVHDALGSHKASDMLAPGKAAMKARVKELIRLYGSSGKADR